MTYVIVLISILIIIALVILFYAPGKRTRPKSDRHDQETTATGAEPLGAPAEEGHLFRAPEGEASASLTEQGPAPGKAETAGGEEPGLEEELELELSFETTDDRSGAGEGRTSETTVAGAQVEEEELVLTLDEIDAVAGSEDGGYAPAEMAEAEEKDKAAAGGEEEIPFILENEEGRRRGAGDDIAPALEGVAGESAGVAEETPEALEERLDLFFGGGEDVLQPEAVEPHRTGEEPPEEYPAAAVGLTLEGYEAELRNRKEMLREALNAALESGKAAGLGLLETKLTSVCGRLTDIRRSFRQRQQLFADIEAMLAELAASLPGFQDDAVLRLLREGDAETVRALLDDAAAQLEDDAARLGARICYLGGCLAEEQTDYEAALTLYRRACDADEANPRYLYAAGRMARYLGRKNEAVMLLDTLLDREGQPQDVTLQALARYELAKLYAGNNEKEKAENFLLSALADMENHPGSDRPEFGSVLHDLAVLYESNGRYDEAEPLYRQALDVIKSSRGRNHPDLAATQNRLAALYEEMELEEKSAPLYEKALEIKMEVLGRAHPDIGTILNSLANLLRQQGRYAEAEPMFLRSLDILEKAMGPNHPNLAVVLNNLAELYSDMGDGGKAAQFEERAFGLFQLPGGGEDFVEMEKDQTIDPDEEKKKTITGS